MLFAGQCRCGDATYTLDAPEIPKGYACHCLDCQTMSGGAVVVQLPVLERQLVCQGPLITWDNQDSRGNRTAQRFCARCKTRLFSINAGRPGVALLRGGTLRDSDQLTPAVHIWTKRMQPWIVLPSDASIFLEGAPPEVMQAIFAQNLTSQ